MPRKMYPLGFLKKAAVRADSGADVCRLPPPLTRQKGLFVLVLLIMACLGFPLAVPEREPHRIEGALPVEKTVTIQVAGPVSRPGLRTYAYPPTVREVLRDAGFPSVSEFFSIHPDREILDRDLTLTVRTEGNGAFEIDRQDLSLKALWILGRPLPLNRATVEDLSRLPGIGPRMAERIIFLRDVRGGFTSLEQLKEVKGIKEKTFAKIKDHFIL